MAPAKTGNLSNSSKAVIKTDHANRVIRLRVIRFLRILIMVVIKLIAPKIEEIPAKWRLKIARSTEDPLWATECLNGGYTVQPVPAPDSTIDLSSSNRRAGGSSQNLMLFNRGNPISGTPSIRGISQFPKPPIITGITIKKIITKAWAVTITLYNWSFPSNLPGCDNSTRIKNLSPLPTIPAHKPNKK